jgi:hypothetical protein
LTVMLRSLSTNLRWQYGRWRWWCSKCLRPRGVVRRRTGRLRGP